METNKYYIVRRIGWNQWYDDGGRWVGNVDAARQMTRSEAKRLAEQLNGEYGPEHDGETPAVAEVEFGGYLTPAY